MKSAEKVDTKPIELQEKEELINLNELVHGNSEKEIRKMVDFMVKSSKSSEDIIQAFSKMKVQALGILQSPQYKNLQQNEQELGR